MTTLTFTILGLPTPQGSKRAFNNPHTGRAMMREQTGAKLTTWRQDVKAAALDALGKIAEESYTGSTPWPYPMAGAVDVTITFLFERPKAHYGTGRNARVLKESAPGHPISKNLGDVEKLIRSTHDALTTAGVWADDCQVVHVDVWKAYTVRGERPGARITIRTLDGAPNLRDGRPVATADVQEALL